MIVLFIVFNIFIILSMATNVFKSSFVVLPGIFFHRSYLNTDLRRMFLLLCQGCLSSVPSVSPTSFLVCVIRSFFFHVLILAINFETFNKLFKHVLNLLMSFGSFVVSDCFLTFLLMSSHLGLILSVHLLSFLDEG